MPLVAVPSGLKMSVSADPKPDRIGVPRHRATIGDPSNPCRHAEYDPGEAVAKPFHRRDRFVDTATNVPTS